MKPANRPYRQMSGKWALITISLLFATSATLRLGAGSGAAIAREVTNLTREIAGAADPETCAPSPDISAILQVLESRETELDARESELLTLSRTLSVARDEVQQQLTALEDAERKLSKTIEASAVAAEDDLARLTSVYENMKPKDAANLFEAMNPEFAAGFIGRMRPDAAAAVMTGLAPEMAYAISVILAGRNADAPTN